MIRRIAGWIFGAAEALVAKARAPAKQKPRVRLMAKDGVIWVKPLCRLGYEGKGDP